MGKVSPRFKDLIVLVIFIKFTKNIYTVRISSLYLLVFVITSQTKVVLLSFYYLSYNQNGTEPLVLRTVSFCRLFWLQDGNKTFIHFLM